MTPEDFRDARQKLGYSQGGLADLWDMGKGAGRTIRRWEAGETPLPGLAVFAIKAMEAGFTPEEVA